MLDIIAKWLRAEGCDRVLTAVDGQDALTVLENNQVDLLISDVRMPRLDGVSLIRSIAERNLRLPAVIFVSGFGDVNRREMYALGVEAFLNKPFRREELLDAMRAAVSDRHALWQTPMATTPRQTLELDHRVLSGGDPTSQLCLGRGGFSARSPEPLSLSKVAFHCHIDEHTVPLAGQGFVRWYARAEQTVGIEFAFLEDACRDWVADAITRSSPRAYIPDFQA